MAEKKRRTTFFVSAENPTGVRNGGTRGKDCEKLNCCRSIAPGETITVLDMEGPGMITNIWMGGFVSQHFILRIYWDNCEYPSVEAPLAAFFGYAYADTLADRNGDYAVMTSSEMQIAPCKGSNSYIEMPFKKHCRITMENRGNVQREHFWAITGWKGEIPEDAEYFHATYRQERPVKQGRSYVLLDGVEGIGRLHGVTMSVGLNGGNICWCEGEAKMYIDGETYPSVNYTGTEDYFGASYAFGMDASLRKYQTYSGLYLGMYAMMGNTQREYDGQQRFMLYRWHVKDAIYFDKSFKMVIDNLGAYYDSFGIHMTPRYDDYASTAYYYLDRPRPVPFALPDDGEVTLR